MTNEDRVFIGRIEAAIEDRDTDTMAALLLEWDGQKTMALAEYKTVFAGATRRDWIDSIAEDCESLIRAIKAEDDAEYWAIRTRV
jgi:hypothetical protein